MTLYDKYEGEILGAIAEALGAQWWENLSTEAKERVHENLYYVMEEIDTNVES